MKRICTTICAALLLVFFSVATAACSLGRLPVPGNVGLDDELYALTWSTVENAHGYLVEVTDANGEVTEQVARRANFPLSSLEVGDYDIRIKAQGGGGWRDSDWTESLHFEKLPENGCLYELINNGTAYALIGAGTATGALDVGETYRNRPVVRIEDGAFRNSVTLESIVIGENVTYIGDSAFYGCARLTSVTIPESVVYIGEAAFQTCYTLNNVVVPSGVTEISANLFNYCRALTNVEIPDVTSIGEEAFANCSALTSFVVPDSVVTIGDRAFYNDTGLRSVTIGAGVENIGTQAFCFNSSLEEIHFSADGGLVSIGDECFFSSEKLTFLSLPEGLERIGAGAFQNCSLLGNVNGIPSTVYSVGQFAFLNTAVYNAAKERGDTYVYIGDWLVELVESKQEHLTVVGEDQDVPQDYKDENFAPLQTGLKGIADAVFAWCGELVRVFLPDTVEYIGMGAFYGCEKLYNVEASLRSQLKEIGDSAFNDCSALTVLSLAGNQINSIGAYAFYNCSTLGNNTINSIIPDSVTHIGMMAFYGTLLYSESNNQDSEEDSDGLIYAGDWIVGYTGYDEAILYMLYMLAGEEEAADAMRGDLSQVTEVTFDESVRGVADYAFYGHVNLTYVQNMSASRYIGEGAFYGCENLNSATLNSDMSEISDYAFYGCENLYSVNFPRLLTKIGRSAFYGCTQLSEISVRRLESIGDFAFYQCINLSSADLGSSVEEIGRYAFFNCDRLTAISLPDSVVRIGDHAYYGCGSAQTLTLGQNVQEIGDYAFARCEMLSEITIPNSVRTIGNYAFYRCTEVQNVRIGSGVESIGQYAFAYLSEMENVFIPANVRTVGSFAFRGCGSLGSVVMSGNIEQMGNHVFFGATNATIYTDAENIRPEWQEFWNSSYCPVVWGVVFSEEGNYVVSVEIGENALSYVNAGSALSSPMREGFIFMGWSTQEGGTAVYQTNDLDSVPVGTTLYAVWQAE
ncbi:MAG TPA: leucine-rich repeat protein [Candidatus Borkfalkia avicola]|uniref:Leucine-rich repeat protein n=1 Tax=Candidatus Borkfalkia avicola TaxID=2838503 RepID=A0A9D2IIQ3_9FIRM|nr:leucine-rich repeat protein [Candidatus Borkfalkia avicola]